MQTYEITDPDSDHSLGYFDAYTPEAAILDAIVATGFVEPDTAAELVGTLEATELDNMHDSNNPDPDWHGFDVGYIVIYRTFFAVGTIREVELAEQALGSHEIPIAIVYLGHGREMTPTDRRIIGR